MFKKALLGLIALMFMTVACDDDDDIEIVPYAGTITGGPFEFVVDGVADMVSGIAIQNPNNLMGSGSSWVITDDAGNILGLPPTLNDLEAVNFDGAGAGICLIWHLRYEGVITGLETGQNASNLDGNFDLSNSIQVTRENVMAASLSGGPFEFIIDGEEDYVSGITVDDSEVVGSLGSFVITDDMGNILGLPPTLADLEGVNFNGAGAGICYIWHITYQEGLQGLEAGENTSNLSGVFALSNSIQVTRLDVMASSLSGGPFEFIIDGNDDFVSGISVDDSNAVGSMSTFVITDDSGNILGLPPTLADLEGVNFNGAGAGICFIWHLTYQEGIEGLEAGNNAADLMGSFALSNSIQVTRMDVDAGSISGGPFTFIIDGEADFVSGITMDSGNAVGSMSTWVITDDSGNILGLPPTLADVEGVNFDGAGAGVCLIWYMRYQDDVTGLEVGQNASNLGGSFDITNSITVNRVVPSAAVLSGGPFTICIDDMDDFVSGITIDETNAIGTNSTFVITDDSGNILGLPPTLADVESVNFNGAGNGVCYIWNIRYQNNVTGLEAGMNVSDLQGAYALSNGIQVTRNATAAATLSGGPFNFTVDGVADMVSGITVDETNASGTYSTFVITDDVGNILGLPPTLADVEGINFDGAGAGICYIWNLRYEEGLQGAEVGMNASDLQGCFSLSNSVQVTRSTP